MAVLVFAALTTDNTTTRATSFQALELVAVWPLLVTGLVCYGVRAAGGERAGRASWVAWRES
jgi:hypothetical protein